MHVSVALVRNSSSLPRDMAPVGTKALMMRVPYHSLEILNGTCSIYSDSDETQSGSLVGKPLQACISLTL